LGEREDWTDLRVYGALLAVGTDLFSRAGVHYLSGFFGPLERALRDSGADIEFTPADFRRFGPLLERQSPRVMTTVAAPPDADGRCSLSLHAGGTVDELHRAGADPDRLLVVEVSDKYPRTFGLGDEHRKGGAKPAGSGYSHALH
ncbi:4-hydroxybutyrate CoA-transferase, partial [Mycobacterium sp. ITM-2017-0098]